MEVLKTAQIPQQQIGAHISDLQEQILFPIVVIIPCCVTTGIPMRKDIV